MAVIINDLEVVATETAQAPAENGTEPAQTRQPSARSGLTPSELALVFEQQNQRYARVYAH